MFDPSLIAFMGVVFMLTITPGSDTMLTLKNALQGGWRAGICTTCGTASGLFVHGILSAVGLSALLLRSAELFHWVKLLGAAYLIYLGLRSIAALWHSNAAADPTAATATRTHSYFVYYRQGLLTNVLNPKVAIFYLAFLPQFIDVNDIIVLKSSLLTSIHALMVLAWLTLASLAVGWLRQWLLNPRVQRRIEAATGLVLVGFGVQLALTRR